MATNKTETIQQIKNAFDFMQKLYNEASYLVKEIEGQLGETEYRFQILKPSGYSISARSSTGLEANNVNLWLLRKFSVSFVEEQFTETKKGQNITEINKTLKVLHFKFSLDDRNFNEPQLTFGVFYNIEKYKDWVKKFENLLGTFEYVDNKLFTKFPDIDYKDGTFKLQGKLKRVNLLDITSSAEINKMIIEPAIELYNQI